MNDQIHNFFFYFFFLNSVIAIVMLNLKKNTYISSLFGIKSNFEVKKFCEISMFRFWPPVFNSYHTAFETLQVKSRDNIYNSPSRLSRDFGLRPRLFRLIVKSHLRVKMRDNEPGDCVISDGFWTQYFMSRQLQSEVKKNFN